jgi:hypothetical protein
LDSDIDLGATYAYYFSGSLAGITDTYAFLGIEPTAYLGLRAEGYAQMQYISERVKLIDTLAWPGLAVKGIAAVGPTMDVWGQLQTIVTLSGSMQVGVRFNFQRNEWFWPDNADSERLNKILDVKDTPAPQSSVQPVFNAIVQATADLNVLVTPEANLGIRILKLVDAQLVAYINTTLNFHAGLSGVAATTGHAYSYDYSVNFIYNLGYGAVANLLGYNWFAKRHDLFVPPKTVRLCCDQFIDSTDNTVPVKRDVSTIGIKAPRRGLLNSPNGDELKPADSELNFDKHYDPENYTVATDHLFKRQKNPNGNPAVQPDAQFSISQLFQCPDACKANTDATPGGNTSPARRGLVPRANTNAACGTTLPDFRINCNIFADNTVQNSLIPGICTGEIEFLNRIGHAYQDFVMTYDFEPVPNPKPANYQSRADARREFSCGRSGQGCEGANRQLLLGTGIDGLTSCDEFPFATTEEGGSFYGNLPVNPQAVGMKCVPRWQQVIQGNCNRIIGEMSTNVAWADSASNNIQFNWQQWRDPSQIWTSGNNPPFNRFARYPSVIPQANNVPIADYVVSRGTLGYMFKRNFTYGLAWPNLATDGAQWGSQAFQRYTSGTPSGPFSSTDARTVICSMNHFGQTDVYRYGAYNGLCVNQNEVRNLPGYGNVVSWVQCKISFVGSIGPAKRSVYDQSIEKVEIPEDAEPLGWMPVEAAKRMGVHIPATVTPIKSGRRSGHSDPSSRSEEGERSGEDKTPVLPTQVYVFKDALQMVT